ncbi:MAG: YbaN family protein [Erysipelotrichales bacterium]|nr:YbaN family protein [Erysipelotrichales bacterium]
MRLIYITLGAICMGIGAIGVVLPVLPTTPFLLLAAFFYAKGSTKFHEWFTSTKLYQEHLHEFVETRCMTLRMKLTILIPASTMMIIAYFLCPIIHGKYAILAAMVFKYYYFIFKIKTVQEEF